jgi:uncharacterized ferritin-like protein (DUF455 family)
MNLRQKAFHCLSITDPLEKHQSVHDLFWLAQTGNLMCAAKVPLVCNENLIPGRPSNPVLVNPLSVKRRAMHTVEGRAIAIHALAHIEFNAINLALDAVWRFPDMPDNYYYEWLKVAFEESKHFLLLKEHLQSLGYDYGDFPAHDSLWEMVDKTKGDVLARMALVPRTMEARGLDAVPMIRDRFIQVKDHNMVKILDIILHDEIGHVYVGNQWFNYLCRQKQLDPIKTFKELSRLYKAPTLRSPFNFNARKLAGFSEAELEILTSESSQ